VPWGIVVAVLAVLVALGPSTPFFRLYERIPLLGWFRVPHRALIVGQFGFAIAAGLGLDAAARRIRWRLLGPLVVLGLLAGATVQGLRSHSALPPFYDAGWRPYAEAQFDAYLRLATMADGERIWAFTPGLGRYSLYPKLPTLTRVRSIDDYEPLALRRQHEYFVFFAEGALRPAQGSENELVRSLAARPGVPPAATRRRMLDLAGLRFLVTLPPTQRRPDVAAFLRDSGLVLRPSLPTSRSSTRIRMRSRGPSSRTVRRRHRPPTSFSRSWREHRSIPWWRASWRGRASRSRTARRHAGASRRSSATTRTWSRSTRRSPRPASSSSPTRTIPDGPATVDGAAAPILATNHLFRGVPAPAGAHRIRFAYRPRSLALGAALSLLTAVALAAGAYRLKTRPAA
jgi:hypothetical protein